MRSRLRKKINSLLTDIDGCGVMVWIVRADCLPHFFFFDCVMSIIYVVFSANWLEGVRSADQ